MDVQVGSMREGWGPMIGMMMIGLDWEEDGDDDGGDDDELTDT